jgi:hypothetical protein
MHFPPSELTQSGTSTLLESFYRVRGNTSMEARKTCRECRRYCTKLRIKSGQ